MQHDEQHCTCALAKMEARPLQPAVATCHTPEGGRWFSSSAYSCMLPSNPTKWLPATAAQHLSVTTSLCWPMQSGNCQIHADSAERLAVRLKTSPSEADPLLIQHVVNTSSTACMHAYRQMRNRPAAPASAVLRASATAAVVLALTATAACAAAANARIILSACSALPRECCSN